MSLKELTIPKHLDALPGRTQKMAIQKKHYVTGVLLEPPFPQECHRVVLAMGCFWGAERKFWEIHGVYTTAVGYAGGLTKNPTYEEVCSGQTGHTEAVLVIFNPMHVTFEQLLCVFWENHDPTQGMRQGYDIGTQYRSAIYCYTDYQRKEAEASRDTYQRVISDAGHSVITTEIASGNEFYYAESYHQQYLAKNPMGYCGLGGTGVSCPI